MIRNCSLFLFVIALTVKDGGFEPKTLALPAG